MGNSTRKFPQEIMNQIIQDYKEGLSSTNIAIKNKCSTTFIFNILKRGGIERRGVSECHRKYTINEHAFDEITPESAYWVGFLMADGTIFRNSINLFISNRDKNHIIKFLSFLKTDRPIIKNNNLVGTSIESKGMVDKLSEYGVIPRKSLTAKVCDELAFNRDFWRGVIDGDGCVMIHAKNKLNVLPVLNLVGSLNICMSFTNFAKNIIGKDKHVRKTKSIYSVEINGKDAVKVLDVLYSSSIMFLDRKKSKASFIINLFRKGIILKGKDNSIGKNVVLNVEKVVKIKKLLEQNVMCTEIAKMFNIKKYLVYNIKYKNSWASR